MRWTQSSAALQLQLRLRHQHDAVGAWLRLAQQRAEEADGVFEAVDVDAQGVFGVADQNSSVGSRAQAHRLREGDARGAVAGAARFEEVLRGFDGFFVAV